MPIVNGVLTWVPENCSPGAPDVDSAEAFDLGDSHYYTKLLPNVIAGIVFGTLGVLGFVFFTAFTCVQSHAHRLRHAASPTAAPPYAVAPPPPTAQRGWRSRGRLLKATLLLFGLACCGICVWGAVLSYQDTDSIVSDFWSVVGSIEDTLIRRAKSDVEKFDAAVANVTSGLQVWANQTNLVTELLASQGYNSTALAKLGDVVKEMPSRLQSFADELVLALQTTYHIATNARTQIGTTLYKGVQDMISSFEPPSMAFEERWRFIPILGLFIIGAVVSLAVPAVAWTMHLAKTASLLAALLWLNTALLMLLGAGLLNGVYTVSGDACFYAETYALKLAGHKISDSRKRAVVTNALLYYFGGTNYSDTEVVQGITGLDVPGVLRVLDQIPLSNISTALMTAIRENERAVALLPPQNVASLEGMGAGLENAVDAGEGSRPCSEGRRRGHRIMFRCMPQDLWIAWTVAGCFLFVLSLLLTVRVVSHTFSIRKRERKHIAAPADSVAVAGPAARSTSAAVDLELAKQPPSGYPSATEEAKDGAPVAAAMA
eukprot:scaffold2.g7209.t1